MKKEVVLKHHLIMKVCALFLKLLKGYPHTGQHQPSSDVMTSSTYDRSQTQLESLRSDPSTYCTIPEGM